MDPESSGHSLYTIWCGKSGMGHFILTVPHWSWYSGQPKGSWETFGDEGRELVLTRVLLRFQLPPAYFGISPFCQIFIQRYSGAVSLGLFTCQVNSWGCPFKLLGLLNPVVPLGGFFETLNIRGVVVNTNLLGEANKAGR